MIILMLGNYKLKAGLTGVCGAGTRPPLSQTSSILQSSCREKTSFVSQIVCKLINENYEIHTIGKSKAR